MSEKDLSKSVVRKNAVREHNAVRERCHKCGFKVRGHNHENGQHHSRGRTGIKP